MRVRRIYDEYDFSDLFQISSGSPTGLAYARNVYGSNGRKIKSAGDVAGTLHKSSGYFEVRITVDGKQYMLLAHRVIYILAYGKICGVIDHKDGCKTNNTLENLRAVSHAENSRNMFKRKGKPEGVPTGVYRQTTRGKAYWVACWYEGTGKKHRKFKVFSVSKYGDKEALEMASKHRALMLEGLKHLGYTERHGETVND